MLFTVYIILTIVTGIIGMYYVWCTSKVICFYMDIIIFWSVRFSTHLKVFFDVWIGECVGINRSIKMHINSAVFFQENIFLTLTFQMKQRFQTLSIVWFCFLTCLFQWHPYNFHHFCGYDFAYLKKKTWYVVFKI